MLLAAAGQTAPYTTYESTATRKINSININNNNNINSSSKNNVGTPTTTTTIGATAAAVAGGTTTTATPATTSGSNIASNAASALMKTLSVRLHRGTEFIKDTVQKALVMSSSSGTTPAPPLKPLDGSQSLKRKLTGTGGVMGSGVTAPSYPCSSTSRQAVLSQPYVTPTRAFLRHFAMAPSELHRSASARKRNPSTDSLLMDLCLFKPIRPMPITPIKINKARGFELKRPKFMPPTSNMYSEDEDEDDEEDEEQDAPNEPEVALRPKLSTLTLPKHDTASAFVPHKASSSNSSSGITQTKDNTNTHTSGSVAVVVADAITGLDSGSSAKPRAPANKRRRRAPLLTAKRRRKPPAVSATGKQTAPAPAPAPAAPTAAAPKRKRRTAAGSPASTSITPMRRSPPMTRQRARQQISSSSK